MNLSALDVRNGLLARGVELNDGLTVSALDELNVRLGMEIDPVWRELYMTFDGFTGMVMDTRTALCAWPLEQVHIESGQPRSDGRLAFGDYLLDSDTLLGDLRDSARPISYDWDGSVLAEGIMSFWEKFLDGSFDKLGK